MVVSNENSACGVQVATTEIVISFAARQKREALWADQLYFLTAIGLQFQREGTQLIPQL